MYCLGKRKNRMADNGLTRLNWYRGFCAHCGGKMWESSHLIEATRPCWWCGSENTFHFAETAQSHEPPPGQICDPSTCKSMQDRAILPQSPAEVHQHRM